MLIFLFFACLTAAKCSPNASVPVVGASKADEPITWAFKKYSFANQVELFDGRTSYLLFKNADLGPFGASRLTIGLKTTASLKTFKEKISIHFDNSNNGPAQLSFKEVAKTNSAEENFLTFDIASPDGVHDVYISIPSDAKSSDLSSVQFATANPKSGQWYSLVVQATARALTVCTNDLLYGCTFAFHGWPSQKIKFEESCEGGNKIVTYFENKVLAVRDASSNDHAGISVEPYAHQPNQVWDIQEFDGGFRFRPRHDPKKCLDLQNRRNADGAIVVSVNCNDTPAQTWFVSKAV